MKMMSNKIVLFDMDGTLTEPREKFSDPNLNTFLYYLTNRGIQIGIVTGSDLRYLNEQMGSWLNKSTCRYKTHLLPCNGTKYLKPPSFATESHKLKHDVSMLEHLGEHKYRKLIKEIIDLQMEVSDEDIPLSGRFIDYRGSMINWCPIGREASRQQRQQFVEIDSNLQIRERVLKRLREQIEWMQLEDEVTVKLGGDTSFDIYPTGWDKTYALKHFPDYDVWFVGDRCEPNGNDYELYLHCGDQGFKSTGPEETCKVIDIILSNIGENK